MNIINQATICFRRFSNVYCRGFRSRGVFRSPIVSSQWSVSINLACWGLGYFIVLILIAIESLWCISLYCFLFRKDYEDRLYFKLHSYSLCPFHSEALWVNTLLSILEGNLQWTHPQLEGALYCPGLRTTSLFFHCLELTEDSGLPAPGK